MTEIDKIAQFISQLIVYLMMQGRIFEATLVIMMVYISFQVFIAFIKAFFGLFIPKQETPEKEVKERVKVVYVIQNSAGNEIRVEESDEDKSSEKLNELQKLPSKEKSIDEKQSWFSRITQFIIRIIVLTIKTIVISTAIIISIVIVAKIFTK